MGCAAAVSRPVGSAETAAEAALKQVVPCDDEDEDDEVGTRRRTSGTAEKHVNFADAHPLAAESTKSTSLVKMKPPGAAEASEKIEFDDSKLGSLIVNLFSTKHAGGKTFIYIYVYTKTY